MLRSSDVFFCGATALQPAAFKLHSRRDITWNTELNLPDNMKLIAGTQNARRRGMERGGDGRYPALAKTPDPASNQFYWMQVLDSIDAFSDHLDSQAANFAIAKHGFDPRTFGLWAQHANHCATSLIFLLIICQDTGIVPGMAIQP